ncbi:MAG TPA: type I restriction enzyme HsdR N-terminal domain-containing protein [Niabella sp.]|mgnify:CR=1 FL=1|nr:type I restriction enzyme HsdR N-terminal domain-containing protein [Niabella sp.]HOZ98297.1 type I restriction enzyme HsdR N-terminal domain-containing protein [Niabella sp.]HQW16331.1 type I restriction enzyme HsdR N-terminal domain-containing protein [Niabella sp.]HQX21543.1 type I restriction enzyme HsdR N-terminal domain-containing protein [Niabella sp.]HQX42707.1 type I restriction enzyme HsdR N-terminal domain-containing protein [Niabella sp.]
MEQWNEICYLINGHRQRNSDEKFFQNEVVNIFEKLGWSRYKNEIVLQQQIRVGSTSKIEPDITIKFENKNVFVVELKRPNLSTNQSQADQLFSYMRQLKLDIGILIGTNFQIYYDKPDDEINPIKIYVTEFNENNSEAEKIIKLFEKQNFHKTKLIAFCEEQLEKLEDKKISIEIIDELEKNGEQKILELLSESLKDKYNQSVMENVVSQLKIIVRRKQDHYYKNEITEKPSFHEKKATEKTTVDGMKIGQFVQQKMRELSEQNIVSRDEIKNLQDLEYSKKTFKHSSYEILRSSEKYNTNKEEQIRYYSKEKFFGDYYLNSQWLEKHWTPFKNWLEKINQQ